MIDRHCSESQLLLCHAVVLVQANQIVSAAKSGVANSWPAAPNSCRPFALKLAFGDPGRAPFTGQTQFAAKFGKWRTASPPAYAQLRRGRQSSPRRGQTHVGRAPSCPSRMRRPLGQSAFGKQIFSASPKKPMRCKLFFIKILHSHTTNRWTWWKRLAQFLRHLR
jgi:hypothetical protein